MVSAQDRDLHSQLSTRALPTLAEAFDPRKNAIAFLRMVLASMVIFSHSFALGGFGSDPLAKITYNKEHFGFLGVSMFFVLSGFLITRSAAQGNSPLRFLWHRFLRILPGYWVALAFCAFIMAPIYARLEFGTFLRVFKAPWDRPTSYFLGNMFMFHCNFSSVKGVLALYPSSIAHLLGRNPFPWEVNGSLWSLPYECLCYLGVAAVTLARPLNNRRSLAVLGLAVLYGLYALNCLNPRLFEQSFPCPGFVVLVIMAMYFLIGSVCFLYREKIPASPVLFVFCLVVCAVSIVYGILPLTAPIVIPYLFLWLACKLPFTRFDARGDFSYGTYIYAFPVQQGLALAHVNAAGLGTFFIGSFCLTLALAVLSYHCVEAPCLRLKNISFPVIFDRSAAKVAPLRTCEAARPLNINS